MRVLVLSVPESEAELAADRLWTAGARAVEQIDDGSGTTVLRTVLAGTDAVSSGRLGELGAGWKVAFVDVDDAPAQTWREFAKQIAVNADVVIRPAWLAPQRPMSGVEIEIEPGGSFGLGDHPTTRMCADATWRLTKAGDRVLDVGCGSGVLSIIAALRGADHVVAIDIAEAAREATDDNARRNRVSDRISASTTRIADVDGAFDLVVANLLAPTLITMAGDLSRLVAPEGRLLVSGVLAGLHDHVLAALTPLRHVDTVELDGWAAVELRHH